jgi:hypothetical protein
MSEAPAAQDVLDEQFLEDFVARWHAAWNTKDPMQVAPLCTDDVEITDPTQPEPLRGLAGIRASMEPLATAFTDYRFESTEPPYRSSAQRRAIMPWRFTGRMTGPLDPPGFAPTNEVVTFSGVDLWEFDGDRVRRTESLFDVNGIAVQIGAAPAPGSTGEKIGVMLQRLEAARRRRVGR